MRIYGMGSYQLPNRLRFTQDLYGPARVVEEGLRMVNAEVSVDRG